jgi:hypothetical protein
MLRINTTSESMLDAPRIALGYGGHVQTMTSLLTNSEMQGI